MFQIREDSMERLMEASQHLHGALVASPLWELLKNEPVIKQWILALREVESQIKPKEEVNNVQAKQTGGQSKTTATNTPKAS